MRRYANNDDERCNASNPFTGRCVLVYGHPNDHVMERQR